MKFRPHARTAREQLQEATGMRDPAECHSCKSPSVISWR